jgi:hypothetical protein
MGLFGPRKPKGSRGSLTRKQYKKLVKATETKTMGRSASKKRQDAGRSLKAAGATTDAQAKKADLKIRKQYDQDNKIINKRGRQTGTKEGYDERRGVKGGKAAGAKPARRRVGKETALEKKKRQMKERKALWESRNK